MTNQVEYLQAEVLQCQDKLELQKARIASLQQFDVFGNNPELAKDVRDLGEALSDK